MGAYGVLVGVSGWWWVFLVCWWVFLGYLWGARGYWLVFLMCVSGILVGVWGVCGLAWFLENPLFESCDSNMRFPGLQCRRVVGVSGVLVGVSKGWLVFLVCWLVFLGCLWGSCRCW